MKRRLLLLFLLLAPWLKAQYDVTSNTLKPFKDYRSCLTGLKNNYGVTVVKAEYDAVEPVYELIDHQNVITGWIVRKANGCGVLSAEGDVQIPAIYETLERWHRDTLIAGMNGKKGIINRKNEWLLPAKYEQLYGYSNTCFFYKMEGKTGVISKDLRELTPAVYDEVASAAVGRMGDSYVQQPYIFSCKVGRKRGIIDLRKGELIPPVYDAVGVVWIREYDEHSEANYIVYQDSLQGVIRTNGTWGVSLVEGDISINSYMMTYDDRESVQLALIRKRNGRQYVCNLQTGKKSADYDAVYPFQTRAIAETGDRLIILDTNFVELYSSAKYYMNCYHYGAKEQDYLTYERMNRSGFWSHNFRAISRYQLNWDDDVIYVAKIIEERPEQQLLINRKSGLLNYVTGKMIPMKYDAIHLRERNGVTYYWAYEFLEGSDYKSYTLTVYDASMKRLKSYKIGRELYGDNNLRIKKTAGIEIFCDQKGKWGAIYMSGETAIPFVHSNYYGVRRQRWSYREQDTFFAFGDEGKMGVFTKEGKAMTGYFYDSISLLSDGILELRKDNTFDLITTSGNPIDVKCAHACIAPVLKVNGEPNSPGTAYIMCDTSLQAIYFVKDNYLYYYSDGVTKKCNESFFRFESDTLLVSYTYEIEKTGLVRQLHDPVQLRQQRAEATKPSNYIEVHLRGDAAPSFYWYSVVDKKEGSSWHVLDSLKKPLLQNYNFDYPTLSHMNYHIFRVNGKYGALSGDYKVILTPDYEYVCYNWGNYFVRKEGKWQLYNPKTGKFSEPFDQISTERYSNGRFVFRGEQIGFIDTAFRLILPMQSAEELVQKNDLTALCGKWMNSYEQRQLLNVPACKEDARILNNRFILAKNQKGSTHSQMLQIDERPYFWGRGSVMPQMYFTYNPQSFLQSRTIQRSDLRLLSFYTDEHAVYTYDTYKSVFLKRVCSNYRIVNKKLVPVKLNDLLKQDEASKEKFKELFLKELNAIQFAGLDCPDYEVLLGQAQDNFTVNDIGLYIYLYSYGKLSSLSFDYRQLKGILQKPAEFGL